MKNVPNSFPHRTVSTRKNGEDFRKGSLCSQSERCRQPVEESPQREATRRVLSLQPTAHTDRTRPGYRGQRATSETGPFNRQSRSCARRERPYHFKAQKQTAIDSSSPSDHRIER